MLTPKPPSRSATEEVDARPLIGARGRLSGSESLEYREHEQDRVLGDWHSIGTRGVRGNHPALAQRCPIQVLIACTDPLHKPQAWRERELSGANRAMADEQHFGIDRTLGEVLIAERRHDVHLDAGRKHPSQAISEWRRYWIC